MSPSNSKTILTLATVTVLSGLLVYAIYFDYKRRNDVAFRKKLRMSSLLSPIWRTSNHFTGNDKKKVDKTTAQSKEVASNLISTEDLRAALDNVKAEEVPSTPEQREQYFMSQVSLGEQMCTQGQRYTLLT
jgi:mitochondrial import receptor subunit TOM20